MLNFVNKRKERNPGIYMKCTRWRKKNNINRRKSQFQWENPIFCLYKLHCRCTNRGKEKKNIIQLTPESHEEINTNLVCFESWMLSLPLSVSRPVPHALIQWLTRCKNTYFLSFGCAEFRIPTFYFKWIICMQHVVQIEFGY